MDINLLRSLVTILSLVAFLGIVVWAYGPGRRERFDEAAHLPFADDEIADRSALTSARRGREHEQWLTL